MYNLMCKRRGMSSHECRNELMLRSPASPPPPLFDVTRLAPFPSSCCVTISGNSPCEGGLSVASVRRALGLRQGERVGSESLRVQACPSVVLSSTVQETPPGRCSRVAWETGRLVPLGTDLYQHNVIPLRLNCVTSHKTHLNPQLMLPHLVAPQ